MSDPVLDRELEFVRSSLQQNVDVTVRVGIQLTTWLVVGSATALGLMGSLAVQNPVLFEQPNFYDSMDAIVRALIAAFVATGVSYAAGMAAVFRLSRMQLHLSIIGAFGHAAPESLEDHQARALNSAHEFLKQPFPQWALLIAPAMATAIYLYSAFELGRGIWLASRFRVIDALTAIYGTATPSLGL